ncbi:hypothetical protein P9112_006044 [Eukaryota sp. TZLM1-RC]
MLERIKKHYNALQQFSDSVSELDSILKPYLSCSKSELQASMQPSEWIQYQADILYTMNSLAFTYLKLQGKSIPEDHPIQSELKRTQDTMKRVKQFLQEYGDEVPPLKHPRTGD